VSGDHSKAGHGALNFDAHETIRNALGKMARAFEAAGIDDAARDARFLLQGVLSRDAASLLRDQDHALGVGAASLGEAVTRRLAHEPVARILGRREFYGRPFVVTADVLDPRPDTEALVDLVLDIVREQSSLASHVRIADIGVGSGAVIATLLAEIPQATGVATDISPAALEVARLNAIALGVSDRLELLETSVLDNVSGPIDVIVSNPPYIPSSTIADLDAAVRNFDPHLALDGGSDGLNIYRKIANQIIDLGRPVWVVLEIGVGQSDAVEQLFTSRGARLVARKVDLGGHIRAVALGIHC
jgi:release factor glutamine methyltransferase